MMSVSIITLQSTSALLCLFIFVLIYVSAEGEWLLHLACLEIHGFSYLIVALLWFQ